MENVSVIIATHNDASYITECLQSVVAAQAAEIIVINDASTDETLDVLSKLDIPQLRVITLTKNSGPSIARNTGISAATHRYCATVDADDVIPPDRLRILSEMTKDLGACAIVDELIAFNSQTRAEMWRKLALLKIDGPYREILAQDVIRHDLGTLKPMLDLHKIKKLGLRYPEGIRRGEDFILLLEIMQRGEKIFATERTHYMLRRRTQERLTSNRPKLYAELLRNELSFHRKHSWSLPQHIQLCRRHTRNVLAFLKNSVQFWIKKAIY